MLKRTYLFISVLFYWCFPSYVLANVSDTFQDSITFRSSAEFKWHIWDYLTNPYLYSLNQKNTVSLILTDLDSFSAASSFLVYGHPVYIALGIGNRDSERKKSVLLKPESEWNLERGKDFNVKGLLGTLVWENYGLGFYFDFRDVFSELNPVSRKYRTEEPKEYHSIEETTGSSKSRDTVSHLFLGIEFGGYSEALHTFSFSVNIGYKQYGSLGKDILIERNTLRGVNDAPLLELTKGTSFSELFPQDKQHFGSFKRELDIDFLGWFVLNSYSNLGIYFGGFFQPSLRGRDSRITTVSSLNTGSNREDFDESLIPSSSVTAYKVSFEPFYNLDSKFSLGEFRFTPGFFISYHKESAELDSVLEETRDATVDSDEVSVSLNLTVSLQFYLNDSKSFSLYSGWKPRLNLYYKHKTRIENVRKLTLVNQPPPHTTTDELQRGLFNLNDSHKDVFLGFQYILSNKAFFHIALTTDRDTSKFSLNQLDFGIDYQI